MKFLFHKYLCWQRAAPGVIKNLSGSKFHLFVKSHLANCDGSCDVKRNELLQSKVEEKLEVTKALKETKTMLLSEGWSLETTTNGDVIRSKNFPQYGKVFLYEGIINNSPEELLNELYTEVENSPRWNKTVKSSKILKKIDDHTDVTYVVAAESTSGLIKCRDFVVARTWVKEGNTIICVYTDANENIMSKTSENCIRGTQGPCAYVLTPVKGKPNKCHFKWLLSVKLNGWLPQKVVDPCMTTVMLDFIQAIRTYKEI